MKPREIMMDLFDFKNKLFNRGGMLNVKAIIRLGDRVAMVSGLCFENEELPKDIVEEYEYYKKLVS